MNNKHTNPNGRLTLLTPDEEKYLINYIQYMTKHASPLTVQQIRGFTWQVIVVSGRASQFKNTGPSEKWWRGFKKSHSKEITLRKPGNLDRGRGRMANEHVVSNHFKTLGKISEENDSLNKPEHIFNVDESGMSMNCTNGKVVVKKGAKAHSTAKDQRDHITVNCCVSANGQTIPPFIIYEKAFPSAPYKSEGIVNALYDKSENGYMDKVHFQTWFFDHFINFPTWQKDFDNRWAWLTYIK